MSTGDCDPISGQDLGTTTPIMENLFAESFLNDHVSITSASYPTSSTNSTLPTLNEAILEPDMFLVRFSPSLLKKKLKVTFSFIFRKTLGFPTTK